MIKYIHIGMIGSIAKVLIAMFLMMFSMASFLASINQARAAELQKSIAVTADNITLGDVYQGVKNNADFVLAPSPEPGNTLVWDAKTLHRIARAFDLPKPNATDQLTIRRLANLITEDMVKTDLLTALKEKGATGQYEIEFLTQNMARVVLPQDIEPEFTLSNVSYNPSRHTFSALLNAPNHIQKTVKGIMHPMVDIPVLKLSARRGEMIGRNDITTIPMREEFITENMIVRADNLVGMTPRKIIRAKSPVAHTDLTKPTLVKRGELVTMQLQRGPIQLSSLAKALETGTEGEIIRLMNIDSKRTIEAEVTGPRTARVLF